ncbi:MAG: 4Fe-4S cluster-binding domain-containing protein [Desulfobulbaceae bacterium]|nr:4Fe-4S cluster-binding domain-containing protein [Desulfobulbaceae bacterium]
MRHCKLCPRHCGVNRLQGQSGYCRSGAGLHIASITLHKGEEPVLSGRDGMCNVFFSHCNLQCIYCQNYQISRNIQREPGQTWSMERVTEEIIGLLERGIKRLGFVSPSHMVPQMTAMVENLWLQGWKPIIVYNSNGYDQVHTLRQLEGIVDIYLPDYKYADATLAGKFSGAQDYPQVAAAALREMYRQMGPLVHLDDDGLALRGMIVRHLVLPGQVQNSLAVLRFLAGELSPKLTLSLMAQYWPTPAVAAHPQLGRRLFAEEYAAVIQEWEELGCTEGFVQELESAEYYWPDFSRKEPFEDTPPC